MRAFRFFPTPKSRAPQVSPLRPGKARFPVSILAFATSLSAVLAVSAQSADQAWLRYGGSHGRFVIPLEVRALGHGTLEQSAAHELQRGITSLSNGSVLWRGSAFNGHTIVGTAEEVRKAYPALPVPTDLTPDSYWLYWSGNLDKADLIVAGGDDRGVLYGAFAVLRDIASDTASPNHLHRDQPQFSIRWVDEWDNPDGSIERGYAGRSIFFEGGNVRSDLVPVAEYGRLLASVGINGLNVNNVNAAPQLIDSDHLKQIARIADALRPWGVHLAMSVAIASPQTIGGLPTYDPLDPAVKAWWAAKVNEIYALIPDFAGFTVKADSEGQPGPSSFGRTPADAANTLAAALAPHNGVVLYRAFVYNHHLDWHDPKADRARAAYDIFHPLDGKFLPNVIVQTKEGPIDFQAREPVSPLFAGLEHTAQAMEVQITQEYTGQQRHLVYLAPMWKQVLDFDLRANNQSTPVKEILAGKEFRKPLEPPRQKASLEGAGGFNPLKTGQDTAAFRPGPASLRPNGTVVLGGMVGVAGIGRDHWLASPLALANLYAFGRLAWNPDLDPAEIATEWALQTIAPYKIADPPTTPAIVNMLMQSWPAYEGYTGPLGMQTLTDITGSHYGPNIESSERNGWGQWHDADAEGVGKDRTVATGSGYVGQYPAQVAKLYENSSTTPDELLLFFHHVPYTYRLHSGKTVVQHIYDSHYDGAAQAAQFVTEWASLKDRVDPALYDDVLARLQYQAGHAIVWRDAIVQYFLKLSGVPDEKGRVGHYPGRLEAEDAHLTGYKVIDITPWEDASDGKAVVCPLQERASNLAGVKGTGFSPYIQSTQQTGAGRGGFQPTHSSEGMHPCTAEWTWTGHAGRYNIAVQYFDLQGGAAKFELLINTHPAATWLADANLPSTRPDGDNSTRHTILSIHLKPGDTIRIEATPDGPDPAALDYIEIIAAVPAP
jgi:alpha-glucuronidase